MNIFVCIKQVPSTTEVKVDPKTKTLVREGVESVINPFDTYALEEAVRLKEQHGGKVTVLTMGPPQAEDALRDALAVGADEAILLSDRAFAGADTLATSYVLARAVEKAGPCDIILCGKQTIDGDTGQVGPEIGEHLGMPCVTSVRKISDVANGSFTAERLIEEGYERVGSSLPCVVTVVREINEPRMPSLRGMMAAKKAEIPVWTAADIGADTGSIGLDGSPTQVVKVFTPDRRVEAEILEGDASSQVKQLVERLKKAGLV